MERLRGAVRVAREVPAHLERADAMPWLEAQLDVRRTRIATVVYHSVFLQYLAERSRAGLQHVIERAARGAVADAPIAWVRMEPGKSTFEVRCALWPGGRDVLLGTCGPHGRGFRWEA
jgi:hypothetical protein